MRFLLPTDNAWQGFCFIRFTMINSANNSRRLPHDAQSIGKLCLYSRQEPGKATGTMARQFEGRCNMLMGNMRDTAMPDELSGGDKARFYTEMFDRPLSQRLLNDWVIGLTGMMAGQLSRLSGKNGRAEIIAAEERAFAAPLHPPRTQAWLEHEGNPVSKSGAYEPKREAG